MGLDGASGARAPSLDGAEKRELKWTAKIEMDEIVDIFDRSGNRRIRLS